MKKLFAIAAFGLLVISAANGQNTCRGPRRMWASINTKTDVTTNKNSYYLNDIGKVLISWRMLPTDTWETSFHLYSRIASNPNAMLTRKTSNKPVSNSTCFQLSSSSVPTAKTVFYLVKGDCPINKSMVSNAAEKATIMSYCVDSMVLDERIYSQKIPYLSIPLKDTHDDVCSIDTIFFTANDVSVGDLDGDGEPEIVVKRLQSHGPQPGSMNSDGTGAGTSQKAVMHQAIWDAYKLDGTFMWRVMSGPNSLLGNSTSFAIADFDGDGKCEMAIRTSEGTVFGDGTSIGDTNNDGIIDYRTWTGGYIDHYPSRGPEFVSVIDGVTGKELARANYISRGASEDWGDDYFKRANSHRMGIACLDETGLPSIIVGRGVYARSVVRAYDYRNGELTIRWTFDTSGGGKGKDGNPVSAYAGQGNHSFNAADLDGDGFDEIMYGSMAVDHDGKGLWTTKLGHGDANHVGKFLPDRDGLQMYHCLEGGTTQVALHDAATGELIWDKQGSEANDMGRCMVADIDPNYPGCEFWMAGSNAFSQSGTDLGYKPSSCNAGIWFDGYLSRQLINENIIDSPSHGRTFTIYRYSMTFINGTKSNPSWYGDLMGDWREEIIVPDNTMLSDLKIFSTWYSTEYKFPYLMSDHHYWLQTVNQNIGYNQPNNLSYFLGTGMNMDDVPLIKENEKLFGDVDGDGYVNITDVVSVINTIASGTYDASADVDGNGSINITDIVNIINTIAGVESEK